MDVAGVEQTAGETHHKDTGGAYNTSVQGIPTLGQLRDAPDRKCLS